MAVLTSEAIREMSGLGRRPAQSGGLLPRLFAWRTVYRFGWLEWLVLAGFCTVTALIIPYHELWADEAQAWLIASHSTALQIIANRLHYEGSPPVWHLLLHAFSVCGGTYTGIPWFGAVFATAGVVVMLRWSPYPLVIRVLLPFTFFFAYQYAVIARSYTLFALFGFVLCILFRRRRLIWLSLAAGAFANLCVQGAIIAGLLLVLCALDIYLESQFVDDVIPRRFFSFFVFDLYQTRTLVKRPGLRRTLTSGAAVFCTLGLVSVLVAWPAPDIDFAAAAPASGGMLHKLEVATIGQVKATQPEGLPDPYLHPEPEEPRPRLLSHPAQWAAWQINHRPMEDADGR